MTPALACAAVLVFYGFAYTTLVRRCGPLVHRLLAPMHLEREHPARDVRSLGKLAAAAVAQALFAAGLVAATGARPPLLPGDGGAALAVVLGVVLGAGEIAFATSLCRPLVLLGGRRAGGKAVWLAQTGGGWMSHFRATMRVAPPWLALTITGLYVGVEELVFRGVLIELLRPAGAAVAIGIPLALFVAVQAFHMPSRGAATFPVTGAAVMGSVHGVLFWQVPAILPLVVAHLTFFACAMWLAVAPRPSRA